jgi:hypothetical protein
MKIYKVLILGTVLGFTIPILSLFSRAIIIGNNYSNDIIELIGYNNYLRILSNVPHWHWGHDLWNPYRIYLGTTFYNLFCMLVILIFKKRICSFLSNLENYLKPHKKALFLTMFLIFMCQSKVFAGWWWRSIGGWTFENWKKKIQIVDVMPEQIEVPKHMNQSINWNNLKKISRFYKSNIVLPGEIHTATFDNNKTIIINPGVLEIVFPERFMADHNLFLKLINYKIKNANIDQKYYPEHSVYNYINYENFYTNKILNYKIWETCVTCYDNKLFFNKLKLKKVIGNV